MSSDGVVTNGKFDDCASVHERVTLLKEIPHTAVKQDR
jgi:hypothetical protein